MEWVLGGCRQDESEPNRVCICLRLSNHLRRFIEIIQRDQLDVEAVFENICPPVAASKNYKGYADCYREGPPTYKYQCCEKRNYQIDLNLYQKWPSLTETPLEWSIFLVDVGSK